LERYYLKNFAQKFSIFKRSKMAVKIIKFFKKRVISESRDALKGHENELKVQVREGISGL